MSLQILFFTPVTLIILIATIAASLYAFNNQGKAREMMLNPYNVYHNKQFITLLSSGFIHADWPHLLFNMITLFFFAPILELDFVRSAGGIMGHIYFAVLYFLSMALADISTIFKHKDNPVYYSLGASGAISAVLFGTILFEPAMKVNLFFIPIGIPAPLFAVLYVFYSIYSSKKDRDNINHEAHLWGAVAGIVITLIFFPHQGLVFLTKAKELLNFFG